MGKLFEGNENVLPIYDNDNLMIGCSYRYLMDMCRANATYEKGKRKNPRYTYKDALKQTLKDYINMIVENTWEEFDLCVDSMEKEMKEEYGS